MSNPSLASLKGIFKIVTTTQWSSESAIRKKDYIPERFNEYFKDDVVTWNSAIFNKEKELLDYVSNSIEKDYILIGVETVTLTNAALKTTFSLYKDEETENYFIIRVMDKVLVLDDSITIVASDGGHGNWSGYWRKPLL